MAAEKIPVADLRGARLQRQAYCARLAAPISARELEDAYVINALIDALGDDPEFGYRFLSDELERVGLAGGERSRSPS